MALTKDFKHTVIARVKRDPAFAQAIAILSAFFA
jgi:hypothetical protein